MDRKYVGVIINIGGSILINLGNNLQSSGHRGKRRRTLTDDGSASDVNEDEDEILENMPGDQQAAPRSPSDDLEMARPRTPQRRQGGSDRGGLSEFHSHNDTLTTQAGLYKVSNPNGSGAPDTWIPTTEETESTSDLLLSLLDCSGGSDEEYDIDSEDKDGAVRRRRKNASKTSSSKGDADVDDSFGPIVNGDAWSLAVLVRRGLAAVMDACRNVWLIGTCLFVLGTVAVFISYSFAPQSLLAPLGSAQFVSNVVFARLIHNAVVTRRMLVSTSIILAGIALVVNYSPSPNPEFSELGVTTLEELYTYGAYQVYLMVLASMAVALHLLYRAYRREYRRQKPMAGDPLVRPTAYAVVSAVVGTQSTLQAKCLSGLLVSPEAGQALADGFTYLTLAGFLLGTAFWLYRMNRALALFEPLFIIPVLQVFWTFFATLNGGIYFREFMGEEFLAHSVGGFVAGVFVIFFGVYLLAPKTASSPGPLSSKTAASGNAGADTKEGHGSRALSPELHPVHSLINKIDHDLPDLDSRLAGHEAVLARRSTSQSESEEGGAAGDGTSSASSSSAAAATATTAGGTAFPVTTRGAKAVAELLEEAQLLLFGDENPLLGASGSAAAQLGGQGAHAIPGAIGSAPTYNPLAGGGGGGAPSYKPRLVSFVGDLPVLIAHEQTARAFEPLIPTLDGMHDSDEEA